MIQREWIVTDYCKNNIKKLGFLYDTKTEYWKYSFPVCKWNKNPVLICKIYISSDLNFAFCNVVDTSDNIYPPFYHKDYGVYGDFIRKAERRILYKLKSLGIIEKKQKNRKNTRRKNGDD